MEVARPSPFERALACCAAVNSSEFLRAAASPRSEAGLRFRDLAGSGTHCHLIAYWGVWQDATIGPEHCRLLEDLADLRARVSQTLILPASIELIFTDTHAAINGVDALTITRGRENLAAALPAEFQLTIMSSLAVVSPVRDDVRAFLLTPGGSRLFKLLRLQASKLFGADIAEERASAYLAANLVESSFVTARWPMGIFLHIGPPELRPMLPSLPILYAFSGRGGQTRKPWFS